MVKVTTTGWPVRIEVRFGDVTLTMNAFDHRELTAIKKSFMSLTPDDLRELKGAHRRGYPTP